MRIFTAQSKHKDPLWQSPKADLEAQILERLRTAGLLVEAPDDPDLPSGAEADAFEAEMEQWLNAQTEPLGLAEAVLEDRR